MNHTYWTDDYMITSLGYGVEQNMSAILQGKSGVSQRYKSDMYPEGVLAAAINWADIEEIPKLTPLERLFVKTISELKQNNSDIDFSSAEFALVISSTKGNIDLLKAGTLCGDGVLLPDMGRRIAAAVGIKTEPLMVSNACISGLSAIMIAKRLLDDGKFKNIVVAGGDILSDFVISGFKSFKSVSEKICRPFDAARDGLTMGEACGAVLLSSNYSEKCKAVVCGAASTNDANHISGPSRTGDGLYNSISAAMHEAGIKNSDVAFISAHGTATVYNDEMESKALALSEMSDIPANSLKPFLGHTLGACGVIESILAVWQLNASVVLPTIGFETLGVPFPVKVSSQLQQVEEGKNYCLKIGSGFGGTNAAVVFGKCSAESQKELVSKIHSQTRIIKTVSYKASSSETIDFDGFIKDKYKETCEPNLKFYKMDRLCKAVYVAAEELLKGVTLPADNKRVAVVVYNRYSSADTDLKHQQILNDKEPASPAVFVYTLPNICLAELCIRHKIKGETTFVAADNDNFVTWYSNFLLQTDKADLVIFGRADVLGNNYDIELNILTGSI